MGKSVKLKNLKKYCLFGTLANFDTNLVSGDNLTYPIHFDQVEVNSLRESFGPYKIKDTVDYNTVFDIFEDYVSMVYNIKRFGISHLEIVSVRETPADTKEWAMFEEKYIDAFEKE